MASIRLPSQTASITDIGWQLRASSGWDNDMTAVEFWDAYAEASKTAVGFFWNAGWARR